MNVHVQLSELLSTSLRQLAHASYPRSAGKPVDGASCVLLAMGCATRAGECGPT